MLLASFVLIYLSLAATASASANSPVSASVVNELTQAGYKLAWLIDSQDWPAFDSVMTQNVTFDATNLLPAKGGIANGIDEVVGAFQHDAANGARTSHLLADFLVLETYGPEKARVSSYIIYSHWVEDSLDDVAQTYRIWYRCDDVWVFQDGKWKVEYMKIYNMGYGIEAPYYDRI